MTPPRGIGPSPPPEAPTGSVLMARLTGVWNPPPGHPPGTPPGTPPGPPPRDPPARGRPGRENFPGPGRAGPGRPGPARAPRAAPGGPGGAPAREAQFGAIPGPFIIFLVFIWGVTPPPEATRATPPGSPGSPRPGPGPKKCTFFWVFNNSPSRDSLGHFFDPPPEPPSPGHPPPGGSGQGPGPVLAGRAVIIGRHQTQSAPRSVTVR